MRYVIAYDVSPDDIRLAVARVLEEVGSRVQESVFEVEAEARELEELTRRLTKALEEPEHGQVRIYRLCRDCHQASFGLGSVNTDGSQPAIVIG